MPSGADTPALVSIPPSQGVSPMRMVFAPRRAAWMAAAVPPVPVPTTKMSVVSWFMGDLQKPGFCDNFCILTEIVKRNPVS